MPRQITEAQRRVERACDLIRSAYRLESLDPKDTIRRVQSAIAHGAEQQAEDIAEEAFRAAQPDSAARACDHPLNYYQAEYLARIERTLEYAQADAGPTGTNVWLRDYREHVGWLVNELKLRLPS